MSRYGTIFISYSAALSRTVVCGVLKFSSMDPVSDSVASAPANSDIHFHCQNCRSALVVASAAAGMTVTCQSCGQSTGVPAVNASAANPDASLADLERQLKENDSQRTEVTGYINQLSIQLHRWKIRLQTLNERKVDLEAQLSASEK